MFSFDDFARELYSRSRLRILATITENRGESPALQGGEDVKNRRSVLVVSCSSGGDTTTVEQQHLSEEGNLSTSAAMRAYDRETGESSE